MPPWLLLVLVLAVACGESTSSPTTPTPSAVEPTTVESFSGTLAVSGARFYSFPVSAYGHVRVTLQELGGNAEPSDLTITMGLGVPQGTDCSTTVRNTISAGPDPQLTSTLEPGIYCVRVADTATLAAPVTFRVQIAHP